VSSPGSGKTTLLCATIDALKQRARAAGGGDRGRPADLVRRRPHPRHRRAGDPGQHRQGLPPRRTDGGRRLRAAALHARPRGHHHHATARHDRALLFIENVGNLVCPAMWDLGEAAKVAILSVTEGEDKPLKYPDMFAAAR
jgi:hydrogenase nickel incorporation protein HypB